MELWLAVFGLVAAVVMIWMSRNRHRERPDDRGAAHKTGTGKSGGGGNGDSSGGDGGGGGGD